MMKSITNITALALIVFLPSCDFFKKESGKVPSFVIVNVLDKEYFDDCHIKGSINVPYVDLKEYAVKHWDKDKTEIVIHCSNYSCTASSEGAKILTKLGFNHVWAFEGGTAEAKFAGIDVEGPCKQAYLNDYKKPEMHEVTDSIAILSVEDLKKKIEEVAVKP